MKHAATYTTTDNNKQNNDNKNIQDKQNKNKHIQ